MNAQNRFTNIANLIKVNFFPSYSFNLINWHIKSTSNFSSREVITIFTRHIPTPIRLNTA